MYESDLKYLPATGFIISSERGPRPEKIILE
jgi:hypothetical protein